MGWTALLDGSDRRRAIQSADRIIYDLRNESIASCCYSLCAGTSGHALLMSYAARAGRAREDDVDRYLDHALAALVSQPIERGLFQGYTGVAWVLEHIVGSDEHDGNVAADLRLVAETQDRDREHRFDLFFGVLGDAVFALERPLGTAQCAALEAIVECLEMLAERDESGVMWRSLPQHIGPIRSHYPDGYAATGLAHGLAGAISVLAQIAASNVPASVRSRARALADDSVRWLIAHAHPEQTARFPYMIANGKPRFGRSVWCHGDLGVATSLILAGRALANTAWVNLGVETAKLAFVRDGLDEQVTDACLCHGAAGVAHLYNRIAQSTHDEACAHAAMAWYRRVLEHLDPSQPFAGLRFYVSQPDANGKAIMEWRPDSTLLSGSAGVAIALLAAAFDEEPIWDRFLGCSSKLLALR